MVEMSQSFKIHELKCNPEYFSFVARGVMKCQFRKNDRNFQAGDYIVLQEYSESTESYSGRALSPIKITHVVKLGMLTLATGMKLDEYVILSLELT